MISRRRLIGGGFAFLAHAMASGAYAQETHRNQPPFDLNFSELDLEPGLPVKVAVVTSGYTNCQIQLVPINGDPTNAPLKTKDWGTEPDRPNSVEFPGPHRKGSYRTTAQMRPTAAHKPSVGMVITQHPGIDLKALERRAVAVRFVTDPVPSTSGGGYFLVEPSDVSLVRVRIWRGETILATPPIFERQLGHVTAQPTPIPWNLKTARGAVVAPGRYIAYLECTPQTGGAKARKTALYSTFGVT